jgi:N6-adenosine-specific RNA methylase IME4
MYDGPYLELFARQARTGWTSWGDEVGMFHIDEGERYERAAQ